jgi:hypothetical protein
VHVLAVPRGHCSEEIGLVVFERGTPLTGAVSLLGVLVGEHDAVPAHILHNRADPPLQPRAAAAASVFQPPQHCLRVHYPVYLREF